ncbi:hypothetical protein MUP37_05890, partial [Candidatus Bathyarchaeota archaeon]|nr:hypothetical protein [Candidatus Bathyarchaeota archaeon]
IKDKVVPKGGSGEPDVVVTPYVQGLNGHGKKVSIERKTGKQKYSATHVEEAIGHAKTEGASYSVLVYDSQENIPSAIQPIHITIEDGVLLAIADVETGGWKTCRWILETLQTILGCSEQLPPLPIEALESLIHEMHSLTKDLESLRAGNNTARSGIEKVDKSMGEIERKISCYLRKLSELLTPPIQQIL